MNIPEEPRVAWTMGNYARALSKSRSWIYALPPELQPNSVKLRRSRLVIEAPQESLRRLAKYYAKTA